MDGSDVGLGGLVINAFSVLSENEVLLSFRSAATISGLSVDDSDIVKFTANSLGPTTAGIFELYFDGSDVGLSANGEDLDAIEVLSNGNLLVSTNGAFSGTGASGADEDIFEFTPTSLGATTSGSFALYVDSSDVGLSTRGEDVDALTIGADEQLYFSTASNFSAGSAFGAADDVAALDVTSFGANTTGSVDPTLFFDRSQQGISTNDVWGIDLPPEPKNTVSPTPALLYLSLQIDTTIDGQAVANEDILAWDGTDFTLLMDGSDVGLGGLTIRAFSVISENEILLSFTAPGTVGGISVDDSDIVIFTATSLGDVTDGSFELFFDGSDVGLTTNGEDIDAIELLENGSLLISTVGNLRGTGASGADEDILVFTPTSLGSATAGSFSLFFDGSDVGLSGRSEDVDATAFSSDGRILLSTAGNFATNGVSGADDDVFVFTPFSLGGNTSGSFASALFFDRSQHGFGGNDVLGIDLPLDGELPTRGSPADTDQSVFYAQLNLPIGFQRATVAYNTHLAESESASPPTTSPRLVLAPLFTQAPTSPRSPQIRWSDIVVARNQEGPRQENIDVIFSELELSDEMLRRLYD
jgi:hypothetical protein